MTKFSFFPYLLLGYGEMVGQEDSDRPARSRAAYRGNSAYNSGF